MRISTIGLDLIKTFEGCKLQSYRDIVGVWTVGFGHTGSDVHPDMTISQPMADDMLARDVARFEEGVLKAVKVPINQNQFDALVCFSYNVGVQAFSNSTLLRLLNERKYDLAAMQFRRWDKAGGRVVYGLTRRRAAERNLFMKPQETFSPMLAGETTGVPSET